MASDGRNRKPLFDIATIAQFIPADVSPLLMAFCSPAPASCRPWFWFTLVIFGSGYAARWLKGGRSIRIIDSITGTILRRFALKMALEPALSLARCLPVDDRRQRQRGGGVPDAGKL